ncbi:MAG: phosphate starvation-inducible protein PsiE, partial [Cyclobacteriaceae bacterium]
MKDIYMDFKNTSFTLFLILFVTVPIIYFLGVFSQDEGLKFNNYRFVLLDSSIHPNDIKKLQFKDSSQGKIDLGVISEVLYLEVDLSEFEGLNKDSLYIFELSNPSFRKVEMIR